MLDERNVHRYQHGRSWSLRPSMDDTSKMHSIVAESTIHTIDVINHETTILEKHIDAMVEQLYAAMVHHIFETAGEGAKSVGNAIGRDEHQGDIPAGFLAMLEKIEFGVDRFGHVQRPTMYVSPSTGSNFLKALSSQPGGYHLKVGMLSDEKEKKAIAREAERIAKFRWRQQ